MTKRNRNLDMKKKIKRCNLIGLTTNYYCLTPKEMSFYIGGSSVDAYGITWFTQDEFDNWKGEWPGGYVCGMGYIGPEGTIYGGHYISYGLFDDTFYRYALYEGIGIGASYEVYSGTTLCNGVLTVGSVAYNFTWKFNVGGSVVVYVNDVEQDRHSLNNSGANIYPTGSIPMGSTTINVGHYKGHVVVKLESYEYLIDSEATSGHYGTVGIQVLFDAYLN